MSAPLPGNVQPNAKRLIEDIEGLYAALKEIRDIAEDLHADPVDALVNIATITDGILWPS